MFAKKKKEKKNKKNVERFISLTANGVPAPVINFVINKNEDGVPTLQIYSKDACEPLHFSEVDFELKTTTKMLRIKGKFIDARNAKKFKLYTFEIEEYNQFFI